MNERETAYERSQTLNTLTCLLKGLVGQVTTIDLRNECCVNGRVMSVDSAMNISLTEAMFAPPGVNPVCPRCTTDAASVKEFDEFYVQGRNVRFVHIPDSIDIVQTIQEQINRRTAQNKPPAERPAKKKLLNTAENKLKQKERVQKRVDEMKKHLMRSKDSESIL